MTYTIEFDFQNKSSSITGYNLKIGKDNEFIPERNDPVNRLPDYLSILTTPLDW